MIKKALRLFLKFHFIFLLLVVCACSEATNAQDTLQQDEVWVHLHNDELLLFKVEMAITPEQQKIGLMNRTHLDHDAGMLFYFGGKERRRSFWMKNTLIPLDMLFLSKDGTIHHIHHMAKPQDEALITAERPSVAVLEINGGYSDVLGIKEGDRVLHPIFRNTADSN